jgi:hypothetical protein
MFRAVFLGNTLYVVKIDSIEDDKENIDILLEEGNPAMVAKTFEDFETLGGEMGIKVELVENDEE